MSAGMKSIPSDGRYFVPLSSLAYNGSINELNRTTGALQTAAWLRAGYVGGGAPQGSPAGGSGNGSAFLSSVNGPGNGRLRDMGKNYTSAGRTFRKVQLVTYGNVSTFGVAGQSGTAPDSDFLSGYIELGWEGNSAVPAPVARMG